MTIDARLVCNVSRAGGVLQVTYSIENRGAVDLGVFNRIKATRVDGTSDYSPDLAYVDLDGSTLHVRKIVLPIPKDLRVAARLVPDVSRIPRGSTLTETASLPIPVKVCNPYERAKRSGETVADAPATATDLEVSLGVFACPEGFRFESSHPAFPDVLTPFPAHAALDGQEVLSARFKLDPPLAVLGYRSAPWT